MSEDRFVPWMKRCDFAYWSTGQHKVLPAAFMEKWARGEAVLLDVRASEEVGFIQFPFALHIPMEELSNRLDEIPRDKLVVAFCSGGDRAAVAFAFLQAHGYENARTMPGGYVTLIPELMPGKVRRLLQQKT